MVGGDCLARHLVLPGSEEARRMTVTPGLKCLELHRNASPVGCLVKMLLGSSAWGSTKRYLTWKGVATKHRRLLFRLVVSMPRISESEYLLWPTATASDSMKAEPYCVEMRGGRPTTVSRTGKTGTSPLHTWVKMWPTMTGCEWKGRGPNSQQQGLTNALGTTGGQLNPDWVEWLMGFPIGWTNLNISPESLRE